MVYSSVVFSVRHYRYSHCRQRKKLHLYVSQKELTLCVCYTHPLSRFPHNPFTYTAATSKDGTARLWDCGSASCVATLASIPCPINSCSLMSTTYLLSKTHTSSSMCVCVYMCVHIQVKRISVPIPLQVLNMSMVQKGSC